MAAPVYEGNDSTTTITTEYEAVLEQSKIYNQQRSARGIDPLVEFEKGFTKRAALSEAELKGMGYSKEEITALKEYLKGNISFEAAATRASADLTATLTNSKHTTTRYTCKYSWSWDKTPIGLGEDAFALAMSGIDSKSKAFETKKMSSSASVSFHYTDGTFYKTETPSTSTSGNSVKCTFDSYKMNSLGDRWVWAKSGYITLSIAPAVSNSTTFECARAYGEYAHSTTSSGTIDISVTVDAAGSITVSFTHSKGNTKRTLWGYKQIIFYNDGTSHEES
ncbi:hypothetical protein RBQ61_09955 [Sedimentibacter sp. MB35-C1]|uniref:hypothetical protein n=1 Tax=Sedimentibacter sp. MB35-C1 TaxID=3070995 RepID=UPI0027E167E9|nr:hypothetical protein [Sedimentibacter sp. MB35-C1]WMJ75954.1 hypothetical protein RBQ61_09955 [Sedimentibacter sp. MB35-C1]